MDGSGMPPKQVGGRRPGSGRPAGRKNKRTVERERLIAEAQALVKARMTPADVAKMSPLDVLRWAMEMHAVAGNATVAAAIAKDLAACEDRRACLIQAARAENVIEQSRQSIIDDPEPGRIDVGSKRDAMSERTPATR